MTPEPIRMRRVTTEASDLGTHVALCQERYEELRRRLGSLEHLMKWLLGTVASGLITIIVILATNVLERLS